MEVDVVGAVGADQAVGESFNGFQGVSEGEAYQFAIVFIENGDIVAGGFDADDVFGRHDETHVALLVHEFQHVTFVDVIAFEGHDGVVSRFQQGVLLLSPHDEPVDEIWEYFYAQCGGEDAGQDFEVANTEVERQKQGGEKSRDDDFRHLPYDIFDVGNKVFPSGENEQRP